MQATDIVFKFIIIIFSIVIHEVAHGYAARHSGDKTAELSGRLTLNPIPHMDLLGTVILPIFIAITTGGGFFGWAKPVPINPDNFENEKKGMLLVSFAGVLANFALAIIFAIIFRGLSAYGLLNTGMYFIISMIIMTNLSLGIFNLIPVPPLDGSKILIALLPERHARLVSNFLQKGQILFIFVVIFAFGSIIGPVINFLFKLLIGSNFGF